MKISKLIKAAKADLKLLEEEFNELVAKTTDKKRSSIEKKIKMDLSMLEDTHLKELYNKRKDRKYASIVIEMYAIIEQLMLNIYEKSKGEEFGKSSNTNSQNTIKLIEESLAIKVGDKKSTKLLALLRNKIVHDKFSLKYARKQVKKKISDGIADTNSEQIKELFKSSRNYIKLIKLNTKA
ncbi:hypothetical protein FLK61_38960 [Paenalkalicoccus suaedae]|uniref:Uncharacterized protein n=1 Tax=Paenalkalicoccus suaedae TaxID=2592382 RepID=A0A859FIB8_9BACI|nr:hypothetical protein [Paenalkalicoccus suaedae]QKS72598.1 hypothetical protein FLK61_38960 [Paenalkalicoccus suaedae]